MTTIDSTRRFKRLFRHYGVWLASVMILSVGLSLVSQSVSAVELQNSEIDIAFHQLRYDTQTRIAAIRDGDESFSQTDDLAKSLAEDFDQSSLPGRKSSLKAGLLSFVVPGLGQVYNGSHIGKVAAFAGAEVGLILGAKKYNNDANNLVKKFESFARANWNEQDYWNYLSKVYGDTTDANDDLGGNHGHHLPSTETQQYFEMIGKYDQFSYGWARSEDTTVGPNDLLPWDTAANTAQYEYAFGNRYPSPKRLFYNTMRADANTNFDNRDRMIIFTIVNHVVSAVDAVISANRHNKKLAGSSGGLTFQPSVRHDENWALIPEVKISWRF